MRRSAVTLLSVLVCCGIAVGETSGARSPTRAEARALQAAINITAGVKIKRSEWTASISTVSPRWALVRLRDSGAEAYSFSDGRWFTVAVFDEGRPLDSLCIWAPTVVVRDLTGLAGCPPYRALHARHAGLHERAELTEALRTTMLKGAPWRLVNPCVSRLDSNWAGATADLPDTGLIAFFHRVRGRWIVYGRGRFGDFKPPPNPITLSLASCVGYNASAYGA